MGGGRPMGCVMDGIIVGVPKVCIVVDDAITCQPNTHTDTHIHTRSLQKLVHVKPKYDVQLFHDVSNCSFLLFLSLSSAELPQDNHVFVFTYISDLSTM